MLCLTRLLVLATLRVPHIYPAPAFVTFRVKSTIHHTCATVPAVLTECCTLEWLCTLRGN